jgi:hypothetical protein
VVGDVLEREVVPGERGEEDGCRDERRAERGDERVSGRAREPAAAATGGPAAREGRVEDEPEGDDEGGAA